MTRETSQKRRIPVGKCPEHGYVTGDDVDFRFPLPARCHCGETLEKCTVADADRVRELSPDGGRAPHHGREYARQQARDHRDMERRNLRRQGFTSGRRRL